VRPTLVVLDSPSFDLLFGIVNRFESPHIQALIPERPVEGFDEAVVRQPGLLESIANL
jgi:hypothetical protein